jgi:multidrug efflux pump subunit AcrA (membrane-fusion protein)
VAVRAVTLGARIGNRWIVEKGVKPNDRVVVDGPSLKDGTVVSPHPAPSSAEDQ